MSVFVCLSIIAAANFLFGFVVGISSSRLKAKKGIELEEKATYCHGFEDAVYYILDEYNPELYKPEIAERLYREYKSIKHGPDRH